MAYYGWVYPTASGQCTPQYTGLGVDASGCYISPVYLYSYFMQRGAASVKITYAVYRPPEKGLPYLAVCTAGQMVQWAISAPDRKSANTIIEDAIRSFHAVGELRKEIGKLRSDRRRGPRKRVLSPPQTDKA
jgi:hypothetical protein